MSAELPPGAITVHQKAFLDATFGDHPWPGDALRIALEAAAPHLYAAERKNVARELMKRHVPVGSEWGRSCSICWTRGDSRAAWPCPEAVAIADLLTGEKP